MIYKPLVGIQEAKRLVLEKSMGQTGAITVSVRCEQSYRCDVAQPVNVLKRDQLNRNIELTVSSTNRPSGAKLKDILE